MVPNIGGTEVAMFLAIVLLLFGAKRIPELAKGLGSGAREICKGVSARDENNEMRESKGLGLPRRMVPKPLPIKPRAEAEKTCAEQGAQGVPVFGLGAQE